ncbi:hypothetical protein ACHQM5_025957 [Ranunculus cassubicifolius]
MHSRGNSVIAKRVWNYLRIAYFMMRKGLISKRKLVMDINMMMKRGKLMRKTLGNLMFHHHNHRSRGVTTRGGFRLQDYEFSCSNSPNPVFFHSSKRKHHYFPCISSPTPSHYEDSPVVMLPRIEYSPEPEHSCDFALGERFEASPFAVRISNYSSDEDIVEEDDKQVDDDAEEFIRRFYEQLRTQSRMQLLQYQ